MAPRSRPLVAALVVMLALLACALPRQDPAGHPTETVSALPAENAGESPESPADEVPGVSGQPPASLLPGGQTAVAYNIYVGGNVRGNCGPMTNSGGFASMTFDTAFQGIHFTAPSSTGLPGPFGAIYQEAEIPFGIPGLGLLGEGELGAFTFCPMYEGDEAHPCSVIQGPHPFEPSLAITMAEEMGDIPLVPLVGTPPPSGGGEALLLFSIGATSDLGPILEWECEMGTGALGGSLSPAQVVFPVSWEQLMQGEEFSVDLLAGDEGEAWEMTMRLVPVE